MKILAPVRRIFLHSAIVDAFEEPRVEGPEDDKMATAVATFRGDERMFRSQPDRPEAWFAATVGDIEAADEVLEAAVHFTDDACRRYKRRWVARGRVGAGGHGGGARAESGERRTED